MKRNTQAVIGYDLNDSYAQISYSFADGVDMTEASVLTASVVLGAEQYNIPTALRQKPGTHRWLYGKEALEPTDEMDAASPVFTRLLDLALTGAPVTLEEDVIDPVQLLALFVKRSLSVLTMEVNTKSVAAFMFTVPVITPKVVEVLERVGQSMDLPGERIFIESYQESIYQYIVHQPIEIWRNNVLLFDFTSHLRSYRLADNKKTTPLVVFIESNSHPTLRYTNSLSERTKQEWDREFLAIAEELIAKRNVSSVFLVGEGFKETWANESLKFLCRGRRVFQGGNLYSKGACYGAMEKAEPSEIGQATVFLGDEKLKANIGMRLMRNGMESYFAIVDGGGNWYECERSFEILLDDEAEINLIITSLTGGIVSARNFALDGLALGSPRTTRLQCMVRFSSASTGMLSVRDLGFGEIFPSSNKEWDFEFTI